MCACCVYACYRLYNETHIDTIKTDKSAHAYAFSVNCTKKKGTSHPYIAHRIHWRWWGIVAAVQNQNQHEIHQNALEPILWKYSTVTPNTCRNAWITSNVFAAATICWMRFFFSSVLSLCMSANVGVIRNCGRSCE